VTILRTLSFVTAYASSETTLERGGLCGAVVSIDKFCYPVLVFIRENLASTSETGAAPQKRRFIAFGPTAYCKQIIILNPGTGYMKALDNFSAYYDDLAA